MVRMKVTKPLGEWPASASKPAPRSLTVCMFLDFSTYLARYIVALYTLLRKANRYRHMRHGIIRKNLLLFILVKATVFRACLGCMIRMIHVQWSY